MAADTYFSKLLLCLSLMMLLADDIHEEISDAEEICNSIDTLQFLTFDFEKLIASNPRLSAKI